MAWIWKIKDRVKIIFIAVIFNFITNLIFINLIWVYGAALATWIWWLLIWVLSEYFLWKKYLGANWGYNVWFEYKILLRNIIFMWLLWFFSYYFINPIFEWLSRWVSFWLFCLISGIWFLMVGIINLKKFRSFILEVKKFRK